MYRTVLVFALVFGLLACKNNDREIEKEGENEEGKGMTDAFREGTLPFQLTDTGLLKNADTTTIASTTVSALIADSIKDNYFGKGAKLRFTALRKFAAANENYYLVRAASGQKKAVFLLVYDKDNQFGASYPFLLPDTDPSTMQTSSIDKSFTITKTITQRNGPDVTGDGKEVVAYDAKEKSFSLIMLDVLNEQVNEIISPIDTFSKTHKFAGDYYVNKKNLISIRDGRHSNQLLVFIHTENKAGDCKGELRGEFLMTSSNTAVYRQGGDPCVLNLTFKGNAVSIAEETGCGNYRGLDCPIEGTFTLKKPQSAKPNSSKPKKK